MEVSINFDPDDVQILISEMSVTVPVRVSLGSLKWVEVQVSDFDSTVDLQSHQVEVMDEDSQEFIPLDYHSALGKSIFCQVLELLQNKGPWVKTDV
jgi:hypothetical protein